MHITNCVICREMSKPWRADNKRGYFCIVCRQELQVGPVGREQIKAGGKPFCNSCGFAFMQHLEEQNADVHIAMTERAMEQFIDNVKKLRKAEDN